MVGGTRSAYVMLRVLIDDAGFGNPSTFGGPAPMPEGEVAVRMEFAADGPKPAFTGTIRKVVFDIKPHLTDDEDELHTTSQHGLAAHAVSA